MSDDLIDIRAEQALEATRFREAELERDERDAVQRGDAAAAVELRSQRMLLEEARLMLEQRQAVAWRRREQLPAPAKADRGPGPMTTALEVARKRQELEDDGKPSGERSIATALGVSRDAVRYALGKDRRH